MARDFQRQELYDAEHVIWRTLDLAREAGDMIELHGSKLAIGPEIKFGSLDGVQRYINGVLGSSWYQDAFPLAGGPVTVTQRKGNNKAHYTYREISMHDSEHRGKAWALREAVALHELAHHVVRYTFDHVASHGAEFAGVLQFLVEHQMGAEAGLLYRSAFGESGVKLKLFVPVKDEGVAA